MAFTGFFKNSRKLPDVNFLDIFSRRIQGEQCPACSTKDVRELFGVFVVKRHPIMTGGLHADEQIFIGETDLFDLGHEQIQAFHAVSKREIVEYSLSMIIQKRCNMFAFRNVNSLCPPFRLTPLQMSKAVQLGETSMYTASQLNQCRCAHQAISVINRLRRSFEEDITSSGKKPNPGSLPAIMAKIALKGKCLGKTAIAAIAAPGGDAAWGNKVFSKESTAALVFQTQSEIDLNTKKLQIPVQKRILPKHFQK